MLAGVSSAAIARALLSRSRGQWATGRITHCNFSGHKNSSSSSRTDSAATRSLSDAHWWSEWRRGRRSLPDSSILTVHTTCAGGELCAMPGGDLKTREPFQRTRDALFIFIAFVGLTAGIIWLVVR